MEVTPFHFPLGLIGLPDLQHLELVRPSESAFLWLNSLEDPDFRFVVIEPGGVIDDYEIEISDDDLASIGCRAVGEALLVLNLVTVRSLNPRHVTVNLAGPLIVNRETGIGKQIVVLNCARYSTSHPLIKEEPSRGVRSC